MTVVLLPPPCPTCGRTTFALAPLTHAPDARAGCPACRADARAAASYLRRFAPSLLRW